MRKSILGLSIGAALFAMASVAAAATPRVVLKLSQYTNATFTATSSVVTCDSAATAAANALTGCDSTFTFQSNPLGNGYTTLFGSVGDFDFFSTSFVGNAPGPATLGGLDATQNLLTNSRGTSAGFFSVDLQAFDYTAPVGVEKYLTGSASLTQGVLSIGESVNSFFYADPSNAGNATNGVNCLMAGGTNNSCNTGSPLLWSDPSGGTYSMRDVIYYTVNAGSSINTTSSGIVTPIPEPMSLSLVGAALVAAGFAARRKAKKA